MSSESQQAGRSPLSKTIVPSGIDDPVELARAELKAALAAIEVKGNLPRRAAEAAERGTVRLRRLAQRRPGVVVAGVVGAAAVVGGAVWGIARLIAR